MSGHTVREVVFDLFRSFGMTTIFGNPGSTELPMFRDFPAISAMCWACRLRGRGARFAVAQDARVSDPSLSLSLATTRNPANVSLRASGRKALLASPTGSGRMRSGSARRDGDPHFNSDACGLGHILPGSKTI